MTGRCLQVASGLVLLLGAAHPVQADMAVPSQQRDLEAIRFSGITSFTRESIISGLATDPELFLARDTRISEYAYRNLILQKIHDGYLVEGFPDVRVNVTKDQKAYRVTVTEGPRVRKGEVRIEIAKEAAPKVNQAGLSAALIEPRSQLPLMLQAFSNSSFGLDENGMFHDSAIWQRGETVSFHENWFIRARQALYQEFASQGYLEPTFEIRLHRADTTTADCIVSIHKLGPVRTVRQVIIKGCQRDKPNDIIEYAGRSSARRATDDLLAQVRDKLYDSMRFLKVETRWETIDKNQADLIIDLVEWDSVPSIRQPLTEDLVRARELARKINRILASPDYLISGRLHFPDPISKTIQVLDIDLSKQVGEPFKVRLKTGEKKFSVAYGRSPEKGAFLKILSENGKHYMFPVNTSHYRLNLNSYILVNDAYAESPVHYSLSFGIGSKDEDDESLLHTEFIIEPIALAYIFRKEDIEYAESDGVDEFRFRDGDQTNTRFQLKTGKGTDDDLLIHLDMDNGFAVHITCMRSQPEPDRLPHRTETSTPITDPERIGEAAIFLSHKLIDLVYEFKGQTGQSPSSDLQRQTFKSISDMLGRAVIPIMLQKLADPRMEDKDEKFLVPSSPDTDLNALQLGMALWLNQNLERYFDPGTWPLLLSKEAIWMLANREDHSFANLNTHIQSPECSPLFFVALVGLMEQINPRIASQCAKVGQNFTSMAYLENDLRVFRKYLYFLNEHLTPKAGQTLAEILYDGPQLERFNHYYNPDYKYWIDSALFAIWEVSGKDAYLKYMKSKGALGVAMAQPN